MKDDDDRDGGLALGNDVVDYVSSSIKTDS